MSTTFSRAGRLLAVAAVLLVPLVGCGDDDDDGDGGSGDASGAEADVTITGLSYDDITVEAGQEVQIANDSGLPHTFTSDEGEFDADVGAGDDATVTAPSEPGEYEYFCEIHPQQMRATLTAE
jgi:plastocyanin